jgi:hypothetical protein
MKIKCSHLFLSDFRPPAYDNYQINKNYLDYFNFNSYIAPLI